jgi:hypothetical protein
MANIFTNLPSPVAAGSGTAIDVSACGAEKFIICDGSWTLPDRPPSVTIEFSNEAVPTGWSPLCTFVGNGSKRVIVTARWMRVTIANYRGGTNPVVNFGSSDDVCTFANLVVPAAAGTGAAVDVTALGEIKTIQISGAFTGAIIMEYSEDAGGVDWAELPAMYAPGSQTFPLIANWARIRRQGIPTNGSAGTPVANLGGVTPTGGGGGSAIFTSVQLQELRIDPELTPAALAAGATDDYNPAGFASYTLLRVTPDVTGSSLTGLQALNDGDVRIIENIGIAGNLTLKQDDAASVAANRFMLPGGTDAVLPRGAAAILIYDATDSRWRAAAFAGALAASAFQDFLLTPAGAPAALAAGATNDYNPAGLSTTARWRLSTNAAGSQLTGLVATPTGSLRWLENIGTGVLTLLHENAGSTAANRFTCPNGEPVIVQPGGAAALFYDAVTSRYLVGATAGTQAVGTAVISPAAITGAQNDYSPASLAIANTIRQDLTGAANLTGLATGAQNRIVTIFNVSTVQARTLTLNHENAGSAAANRFSLPNGLDWIIPIGGCGTFWYDITSSRWRPLTFVSNNFPAGSAAAPGIVVGTDIDDGLFHSGTVLIATADGGQSAQFSSGLLLGADQITAQNELTASGRVEFAGVVSPAALNGTVNDYAPAGINTACTLRQALTGASVITGIVPIGGSGRQIMIVNLDAVLTLTINHEDAGSSAANRFSLPGAANIAIGPLGTKSFRYDATSSRWRPSN